MLSEITTDKTAHVPCQIAASAADTDTGCANHQQRALMEQSGIPRPLVDRLLMHLSAQPMTLESGTIAPFAEPHGASPLQASFACCRSEVVGARTGLDGHVADLCCPRAGRGHAA